MSSHRIGWVSCLSAALAAAACGAGSEKEPASNRASVGVAQEPVLGGTDAPDAPAIVSVFNQISIGACSGALIADNVVLTTRRCITGNSFSCCHDFGVTFDPAVLIVRNTEALDLGLTGEFWRVTRVVVPKGTEVCGNDLALLVLDGAVPAKTASPLAPRLDAITKGETLTAFGYGPTTPNGPDPGRRRKREGVPVVCTTGCEGAAPREWVAGEGLCAADGPAVDTAGRLVGVAARVADDCTLAVFESLAAHASFLRAEVSRAALESGGTPPGWATSGPDSSVNASDPDGGPLDAALCKATPSDAGGASASAPDGAAGANVEGDASAVVSPAPPKGGGSGGCGVSRGAESTAGAAWLLLAMSGFRISRRRKRGAACRAGKTVALR